MENESPLLFHGLGSILFWTNPSLISLLQPLRNELGEQLYSLLVAHEASKGTFEDYHSLIGENFLEGFQRWSDIVASAGWGQFSTHSVDFKTQISIIQIDDPWEMRVFKSANPQDAVPFISGKLSGIFGHAFKTNCRAEVHKIQDSPARVILRIRSCHETLETALANLQARKSLSETDQLKSINVLLRNNQQRLFDILSTIGERIWEVDRFGLIRYNSAATSRRAFQDPAATLGKPIISFFHDEDIPLFEKNLRLVQEGKTYLADMKIRVKGPDASYFWVNIKFKALKDVSGHYDGILGSSRDIQNEVVLEQKLEEQRRRSMHASKMAALGEMAAGVAHEINNPLTEIVTHSWVIKEQIVSGELRKEELVCALEAIESKTKRMASIIKGMKTLALEVAPDPFISSYLRELLDEALMHCQQRLNDHAISLKVIGMDPLKKIECRTQQIVQATSSLINNAIDAIEDLDEKWIEIRIHPDDQILRISVTDSGTRIRPDIVPKLMQPFFTTKGPGRGTGLGLPIAKGIIESHGGSLDYIESCPHTRFRMEIPFSQQLNINP